MSKLAAAEIVTPRALDAQAKQQLVDELEGLCRRIFRGADRDSLLKHVIDTGAEHTWIQLYRSEGGALGGYMALHVYEREIGGKMVAIVRCQTGTLREHRGTNLVAGFFAERMLRYRLAHPRRRLCFVGVLVHPSSYAQLVRYVDEVWPREGAETPAEIREFLETLGDAFGFARVDPDNSLVRLGGWRTIDARGDRAYWETCDRPGVQYFLGANPGYVEGRGLLTLAPLTLGTLTRGIARYMLARGERGARKLASRTRAGIAALLPAEVTA